LFARPGRHNHTVDAAGAGDEFESARTTLKSVTATAHQALRTRALLPERAGK
jgi:hypothetical protein